MKIVTTLVLAAVIILALFVLLLGSLGVSIGVRAGGNTFAEEGSGLLRPALLIPLIIAAVGGLYLLWRGGRATA